MINAATHSMYYVATLCPPAIDDKVQKHKVWMRDHFGCVVALKSPAHITLIPPFWLNHTAEQLLIETVQSFQTDKTPIELQLHDFSHFTDKVIFITVVENQPLNNLRIETEDHFIQSFHGIIKPDERPFHPHITIANRDIKPSDFKQAWQHFAKESFKESFQSNIISLLKLSAGKWNVIAEQQY